MCNRAPQGAQCRFCEKVGRLPLYACRRRAGHALQQGAEGARRLEGNYADFP